MLQLLRQLDRAAERERIDTDVVGAAAKQIVDRFDVNAELIGVMREHLIADGIRVVAEQAIRFVVEQPKLALRELELCMQF